MGDPCNGMREGNETDQTWAVESATGREPFYIVGVGASAMVFSLADLPPDLLPGWPDGGGVGLGASAADGAGVGGDDACLTFTWGALAAATSSVFAVLTVAAAALSVLRGCCAV